MMKTQNSTVVTHNACKLCTPLGACLVFRGIEGCLPFLHGSQGCATYIRRYLISHFREPIDIASSNFHEENAVFGGSGTFQKGVANVIQQYRPRMVGIATTCLAETIGEDMPRLLLDFSKMHANSAPLVSVSTASYRGTHIDGFHSAVSAVVNRFAAGGIRTDRLNIFPGMVSAGDLRLLKDVFADFSVPFMLLPDYSESMDGETWEKYEKLQPGGTPIGDIVLSGQSRATIEFGLTTAPIQTAGRILNEKYGVPRHLLGLPVGMNETDKFMGILEKLSGRPMPAKYVRQRGRLLDSYIDGHKYVFEKRAVVYGEEDLVIGLTAFLSEIGVIPALCASGGKSGQFEAGLKSAIPDLPPETIIKEGCDFAEMAEVALENHPDLLVGSSKGYSLARKLEIPLLRVGFPIHDRIGGQRVLHLGYQGAQELYDRLVNSLLERKQELSDFGYSYL